MMSLFDLMQQAQGGKGMEAFAQNFDIDSNQANAALEALLPAFSQGLTRNASNPQGMADFMQALSSGQHAQYFDNMQAAMQPEAIQDGNGILGYLFGSKDVSRAIAQQAANSFSLNQETLKSMLPIIASMLMGGLFKQGTGQMNQRSGGAAPSSTGNVIGDIIGNMMRQAGGQSAGANNPIGDLLEGMFKQPQSGDQRQERAPQQQSDDNPWEDMLRDIVGGNASPAPQQRRQSTTQQNPFEDAFGEMFRTGKKVQDDYQRGVNSIFDQYLDGMNRR